MALNCYLIVKGFRVGFHYLAWCMVWMVPGVFVSGGLFATVAIMQLYLRYILLSFALEVVVLCQEFEKKNNNNKKLQVFSRCIQCLWVCMVTQLCSPSNVWGGGTHVVCIHKAHFPSSPRLTFFTGLTN